MSNERGPASEDPQQQDPIQRAVARFEKQVSSSTYSGDALKRALDSVRRAGTRAHTSPGELYASLANLSAKAAETAQQHGVAEDATAFTEQQQTFQQTSEQLTPQEQPRGRKKASKSTSPSNPRRTTGRAAG